MTWSNLEYEILCPRTHHCVLGPLVRRLSLALVHPQQLSPRDLNVDGPLVPIPYHDALLERRATPGFGPHPLRAVCLCVVSQDRPR